MSVDRSLTLEELEGKVWGEPPFSSHLVKTTYALRKKPLQEFTPEDLRIMIGQAMSLNYLIPLAIPLLEKNMMTEGDLYPGDLAHAVLRVSQTYWLDHQMEFRAVKLAWKKQLQKMKQQDILHDVVKAYESFKVIQFKY